MKMDADHTRDLRESRAQALARLAALQRLKEQADRGNRIAMLKSLEQLIELETGRLRSAERPNGKEDDRSATEAA